MLGAALSSIGHDRHQLLAATWRSVSHFPMETNATLRQASTVAGTWLDIALRRCRCYRHS